MIANAPIANVVSNKYIILSRDLYNTRQ